MLTLKVTRFGESVREHHAEIIDGIVDSHLSTRLARKTEISPGGRVWAELSLNTS